MKYIEHVLINEYGQKGNIKLFWTKNSQSQFPFMSSRANEFNHFWYIKNKTQPWGDEK